MAGIDDVIGAFALLRVGNLQSQYVFKFLDRHARPGEHALALSGGFAALAVLSVASRLIVYLGCIAALPVIERREGLSRSARGNAVIAAAAIACVGLISGSEAASWQAMVIAVVAGAMIYFANRQWRARTTAPSD